MKTKIIGISILIVNLIFASGTTAATNLKLNPELDYNSDSNEGPLITGENMNDARINRARPYYIIFYDRECYNSKRQAKRTVELYEKFKDRVEFIIVDVDEIRNADQLKIKNSYYRNYIPHITITDSKGKLLYDRAGEVGVDNISTYLESSISDN